MNFPIYGLDRRTTRSQKHKQPCERWTNEWLELHTYDKFHANWHLHAFEISFYKYCWHVDRLIKANGFSFFLFYLSLGRKMWVSERLCGITNIQYAHCMGWMRRVWNRMVLILKFYLHSGSHTWLHSLHSELEGKSSHIRKNPNRRKDWMNILMDGLRLQCRRWMSLFSYLMRWRKQSKHQLYFLNRMSVRTRKMLKLMFMDGMMMLCHHMNFMR